MAAGRATHSNWMRLGAILHDAHAWSGRGYEGNVKRALSLVPVPGKADTPEEVVHTQSKQKQTVQALGGGQEGEMHTGPFTQKG